MSLLRRLISYVTVGEEERVQEGMPTLEQILEPKSREDLLGQAQVCVYVWLGLCGRC